MAPSDLMMYCDVLTASDVPQQSPLSNAIHTMFELAAGKASQMVNGPFDG